MLKSTVAVMPIASPRYAFSKPTILGAPEDSGVYALCQGNEIVFFEFAQRDEATIRARLLEHLLRQREPTAVTHYSWEICRDVPAPFPYMLREHQAKIKRLPRYW